MNLRWSWDEQTRDLFRWVDPDAWDATVHDPVGLLGLVPRERLDALAADAGFLRFLGEVRDELQRYLDGARWFQAREATSPLRSVAYFSPEFGIAEALPQYSGGLGVLAGDHLKAASDLGVPLVGVGLFYRHGYFRQALDRRRLAAGALPRPRPATPWRSRRATASRVDGRPRRRAAARPGVAGRRRPHPALPARRRRRGERRRRPRRSPTASTAATPSTGSARRSSSASAACGRSTRSASTPRCSTPTRATPVPRPRAHPPAASSTTGSRFAEAIEAVRAGVHLHHPHAGAGRHRPLPPRADRALLRRLGRRVSAHPRRAHGARPPARRRARRALQHGGDGPAPGRPVQRAWPKLHGEVSREMFADLWPDVPDRRGADHVGHQRRARRHVGRRPRWPTCSAATCCPSGTRPAPSAGRASTRPATTSCGGRASRAASGWSPSCASGCASQLMARGLSRVRRRVDRRGARPRGAHHLLRPPLRHLQAGHAAAVPARPAASAAAARRDRPVQFVFAGKAHPADDARQGADPPDRRLRRRPRRAPPLRVPRGLRHRRRPHAATRAPTCGSTTRGARRRPAARRA